MAAYRQQNLQRGFVEERLGSMSPLPLSQARYTVGGIFLIGYFY